MHSYPTDMNSPSYKKSKKEKKKTRRWDIGFMVVSETYNQAMCL